MQVKTPVATAAGVLFLDQPNQNDQPIAGK
jgi:hypothetical protein